jgi:hypothetical protein
MSRTRPWNKSGRYLVALQTDFQDRMPQAGDAAEIVLIDTHANNALRVVDQTRAWNPQQGTMLYWNPEAPETQFFFNDRDPKTNDVFCVLFDLAQGKRGQRVAEYRFDDGSIGNGGVAQRGGWFAGINYGRIARLRPVTGYPDARDWTADAKGPPANDGIFKVNTKTKERELLVSFKQLAAAVRAKHPDVDEKQLFLNHTLWSRDDRRLFFFLRADFDIPNKRLNIAFTINADGTGLQPLAQHIGGHPEWASDHVLIGSLNKEQVLFDVEQQKVVGTLGTLEIFPQPEGDVSLSPDTEWFVNGHGEKGKNYYTIFRRADGAWTRTEGFDQNGYVRGDLRIDPAPCWKRDGTQLAVTATDAAKTRQMFVITVKPASP